MKCIQCAAEVDRDARYCPCCGAEQPSAETAAQGQEKRRPVALLRLAALAGELCLMSGLVSCQGGGPSYTGIDILRRLVEEGAGGFWDWEGALCLLLCSVGAALVLLLSFFRKRWAALWTAVISLASAAGMVALFIYYRLISETITLLTGAYLMLAAYLTMLVAAVRGYIQERKKT